jgi:hypothetical protein
VFTETTPVITVHSFSPKFSTVLKASFSKESRIMGLGVVGCNKKISVDVEYRMRVLYVVSLKHSDCKRE